MTGGGVMLETTAYAAFKAGHSQVVQRVQASGMVYVPVLVWAELQVVVAAMGGQHVQDLAAFGRSGRVQVVPLGQETAVRYAHIWRYVQGSGQALPAGHLWVAALAMEWSVPLLTADRRYLALPQILVQEVA